MVVSNAYLGFLGLGLEENGSFGKTHPHVVSVGLVKEGWKNVILRVEPKVLGVVGVSGALSYGVSLTSA